jgi:hypothetical protein
MSASIRQTFAEFGQEFMDRIVTASVVAASIDAVVPKQIDDQEVEFGGAVKTVTHATVGKCVVKQYAGHVFSSTLPIQLKVDVHFPVGSEEYEIQAEVTFWLQVQTWKPLTIFVAVSPVKADDVSLIVDDESWFGVAEKIGGLEGKVRQIVAEKVDESIANSAAATTVELLPLVKQALTASNRPLPTEEPPPAGALPAPPDLPEIKALKQSRGPG